MDHADVAMMTFPALALLEGDGVITGEMKRPRPLGEEDLDSAPGPELDPAPNKHPP